MADRERRALLYAHQEWLGFVQPVGLVVSPPVMVDAQVVPDRNVSDRQSEFRELLEASANDTSNDFHIGDLRHVFVDFLGWEEDDLVDARDHRDTLEIAIPELQTVLTPTWAVRPPDLPTSRPPDLPTSRPPDLPTSRPPDLPAPPPTRSNTPTG